MRAPIHSRIDWRTLIDPRTGIIRRVESRTLAGHLPRSLKLVASVLSDTTRFSSWPSDPSGAGCAFWDEEAAAGAAVGEAVERYCGNLVPDGLLTASHEELIAGGASAVNPETLALYSPAQYGTPGFPFVPFTRDLAVAWAPGRGLVTGAPVFVPASLIWVTYFETGATRGEPRTNGAVYAGVAAGRSRGEAEWRALCELIERDAVALAWTGGGPVKSVEPPAWLARLGRGPEGALRTRFCEFGSELGFPVMGALVFDELLGCPSLGTACRSEPEDAMLKALAEALQQLMVMRDLDEPTSAIARIAGRPESPLKPWRPDRSYLLAYRPDWRDVTDPGCHLQIYLDPALNDRLEAERFLQPGAPEPTSRAAPSSLSEAAARLGERGIPLYSVDVTTDDVRRAGLHVIRLVAPGLYSNAPAAFPFLGGPRLERRLQATGRPPRLLPLPH